MGTIDEEFEWVRTTFFPRWDRKRQWRVIEAENLDGYLGFCDRISKSVLVLADHSRHTESLRELLIHEIAHAVSPDQGHGLNWERAVKRSLRKAETLGLGPLVTLIQKDIEEHAEEVADYELNRERYGNMVSKRNLYKSIKDLVIESPEISYEEALEYVRVTFTGAPRQVFDRHYPKCRKAFDEGKHFYARELELQRRFSQATHPMNQASKPILEEEPGDEA